MTIPIKLPIRTAFICLCNERRLTISRQKSSIYVCIEHIFFIYLSIEDILIGNMVFFVSYHHISAWAVTHNMNEIKFFLTSLFHWLIPHSYSTTFRSGPKLLVIELSHDITRWFTDWTTLFRKFVNPEVQSSQAHCIIWFVSIFVRF